MASQASRDPNKRAVALILRWHKENGVKIKWLADSVGTTAENLLYHFGRGKLPAHLIDKARAAIRQHARSTSDLYRDLSTL